MKTTRTRTLAIAALVAGTVAAASSVEARGGWSVEVAAPGLGAAAVGYPPAPVRFALPPPVLVVPAPLAWARPVPVVPAYGVGVAYPAWRWHRHAVGPVPWRYAPPAPVYAVPRW